MFLGDTRPHSLALSGNSGVAGALPPYMDTFGSNMRHELSFLKDYEVYFLLHYRVGLKCLYSFEISCYTKRCLFLGQELREARARSQTQRHPWFTQFLLQKYTPYIRLSAIFGKIDQKSCKHVQAFQSNSVYLDNTGLPNKACPRLRDLAAPPARRITQPRTNLIREPCMWPVVHARRSGDRRRFQTYFTGNQEWLPRNS